MNLSNILLTDMIPTEILQEVQDAFSDFTGMAALITDAKGVPITKGSGFTRFCMEMTRESKEGRKKCESCDRQGAFMTMQSGKPAVYTCHAGLTDYAAPILLNGGFIGSLIGGQVRTEPVDEDKIREKAVEYDVDPDEYVKAAKAINELRKEEIDKAAYFLQRLAGVLSRVAFQSYQALLQNHEMKEDAKSQSDFMMQFSKELKQSVSEMYSFFSVGKSKEDLDERIQKKVYGLMARTLELGSIVEDKFDYIDIKNGDFKLSETVYNIRAVVEMKIKEFTDQGEISGDKLSYSISDEVPEKLVGDPSRIGSMIGKLIESSNMYNKGTWIRVEVDARKESYSTDIIIRVADGGGGIEKKRLEFMRGYLSSRGLSEVRDEEFDKSGFSLVGYHINAMSGSLQIISEPGEGTEFIITIPQLMVTGG